MKQSRENHSEFKLQTEIIFSPPTYTPRFFRRLQAIHGVFFLMKTSLCAGKTEVFKQPGSEIELHVTKSISFYQHPLK